MSYILPFSKISAKDIKIVGGKVSSLGEMYNTLRKQKILVPNGFCVTSEAFQFFLSENELKEKIHQKLKSLNVDDVKNLQKISREIKKLILGSTFPKKLESQIIKSFKNKNSVAVRSSATCEDLPTASFAGLHESFVFIKTPKELLVAIKKVFASLYNTRAIAYRKHHDFSEEKISMAVGVQQMVKSENASSGVMFTIDTETGFDKVVVVNGVYGLGEGIVSGKITPDEFVLYKRCLENNKLAILKRSLGDKSKKMIHKNEETILVSVEKTKKEQFCLTDQEVKYLGRQALIVEKHYKKPMDIEWAKDQQSGRIYIVQARPETVKSQQNKNVIKQYHLKTKAKVICTGRSVGDQIGHGSAQVIRSIKEMGQFRTGSVLVADITDPDWEPIMKKASAIVTNRGGRTCHAAIVARELGVPAIVGTGDATKVIKNNQLVTISCAEGDIGKVYGGVVDYEINEISLKKLPKLPVKLTINLGNPEQAFALQSLPNDGVGLARLEFIIANMIGVHPNTILDYKKLPVKLKKDIAAHIAAYKSPKEFYIEKLREGISTIAAAFYPKQVIFRFSDFKSNEYANLLGGELYEPQEENPMIGFRGAARYISAQFKDCFEMECEALKRVRNDMGLVNAQAMIPFARTVHEAKEVVKLIKSFGLIRGKNKFKLYMMCEIPSNVLSADEFLKYFDGFSIGSNDLTQLTLGIDRDSELIASEFDERNPAVKKLLEQAISACSKANKYVGICGQAPSDYPELAEWLVSQGITSLSLTPDSIVRAWMHLGGS